MQHPLPFKLLATQLTSWDPASVSLRMNLRLDGCIVPSDAEGARLSYSHIAVLDNFIDDATRRELLHFLTGIEDAPPQAEAALAETVDVPAQAPRENSLPQDRWERRTADMAGGAPTWGLKQQLLEELAAGRPPAVLEVQSRLCKLYPEYDVAHMPSAAIQGSSGTLAAHATEESGDVSDPVPKRCKVDRPASNAASVDCSAFLANAAVEGDTFRYHVDADPTSFPSGPWTEAYGDYFNGEPGRPLLISLLLYLDDQWDRDWAADTLFLDGDSDTGVFVRPRPGRAVLMDQDVLHRVSAPSAPAGGRPRVSLVWKLVMLPRDARTACCLARPEWGQPVSFGSAARVDAVKRQLAAERRQLTKGEDAAAAPAGNQE